MFYLLHKILWRCLVIIYSNVVFIGIWISCVCLIYSFTIK